MFIAVVSWDQDGRGIKSQAFPNFGLATAHVAHYGGFVAESDVEWRADWKVVGSPGSYSLIAEPLPAPPAPTVISYVDFRARFTAQELTDVWAAAMADPSALDLVFIALSEGSVNLGGAKASEFLDKMVAANAITAQRKTEILTP